MATLRGGNAHHHASLGEIVKKSSAYNSGQNGRMAGSPDNRYSLRLFVFLNGCAVSQDPNPGRSAQEQDTQVDRVEPELKQIFHFVSPRLSFAYGITGAGELTSPARGDSMGD